MAHLSVDQQLPQSTSGPSILQRPTMRRKSSANNLLSSFSGKPPPSAIQTQPLAGQSYMPGIMTPTGATTPLAREWDAQSLHADNPTQSPNMGQGTSVEYLRELIHKRILTLTYLRSMHEGQSHWFHTVLITRADLDRAFNNSDMKKRTHRYAILGMSLSSLLDINAPQDLLRGVLNTLSEFDQSKVEKDPDADTSVRPKVRGLFNRPKNKRPGGGGGISDYSVADATGDASYLVTPHMPFGLDYHQTLLSLLDVLSEVYHKIGKVFGPSPFPHTSQHMILGSLSPHPGVSYLFPDSIQPPAPGELDGSLWGIANAGIPSNTFVYGSSSSQASGLGEMVLKIDNKFRKITSVLLKELDTLARSGIKEELQGLDPLLRNLEDLSTSSGGRVLYDIESER